MRKIPHFTWVEKETFKTANGTTLRSVLCWKRNPGTDRPTHGKKINREGDEFTMNLSKTWLILWSPFLIFLGGMAAWLILALNRSPMGLLDIIQTNPPIPSIPPTPPPPPPAIFPEGCEDIPRGLVVAFENVKEDSHARDVIARNAVRICAKRGG